MLGAIYGFGTLTMDFPSAKLLAEEYSEGPIKKRTFKLGGGNAAATMKLQTASGSIWVKKQPTTWGAQTSWFTGWASPTAR